SSRGFGSKAIPYCIPEQPPPATNTRRPVSAGRFFSASSVLIFSTATGVIEITASPVRTSSAMSLLASSNSRHVLDQISWGACRYCRGRPPAGTALFGLIVALAIIKVNYIYFLRTRHWCGGGSGRPSRNAGVVNEVRAGFGVLLDMADALRRCPKQAGDISLVKPAKLGVRVDHTRIGAVRRMQDVPLARLLPPRLIAVRGKVLHDTVQPPLERLVGGREFHLLRHPVRNAVEEDVDLGLVERALELLDHLGGQGAEVAREKGFGFLRQA